MACLVDEDRTLQTWLESDLNFVVYDAFESNIFKILCGN